MKALSLTDWLSQFPALHQFWTSLKDQMWWVLVAEGVVILAFGLIFLLVHFRSKSPKNKPILKENLKDLDLGLSQIRQEAHNLLLYIENLTGEKHDVQFAGHAAGASPRMAPSGGATTADGNAEIERWKKRAEELQFEVGTLNAKLAQSNTELGLTKSQLAQAQGALAAKPPMGAGGADPNPALQIEVAKLQQEKLGMQGQLAQLQKSLADSQAALKAAPSAASGTDDSALKDKIKFLENQLQEYAILEEDLANIRALRQENEQLKAQLGIGGSVVAPTAMAPTDDVAVSSSSTAPEQAAAPPPEETQDDLIAQLAAAPEQGAPAAQAAGSDPFQEFDTMMNEFDQNAAAATAPTPEAAPEAAAETSDAELAAQLAAGSEAQPLEGTPNPSIEDEFNKFVQ